MKLNSEHPSFISYLNEVTNKVFENIDITNYFILNNEKKLNIQLIVFALLDKNIRNKVTILSEQLKTFLIVLVKKNEKIERYEVSAVLNDIVKNFDVITNKINKTSKIVRHTHNIEE